MERDRKELVGRLLGQVSSGDQYAHAQLLSIVHVEIQLLSDAYLMQTRSEDVLPPITMVEEARRRLLAADTSPDRVVQYYIIAAKAIRRIVSEHSRPTISRGSLRNAKWTLLSEIEPMATPMTTASTAELDKALFKLAAHHPRRAWIIELRYFAGLTTEAIGSILEMSAEEIDSEWAISNSWLLTELQFEHA